VEEDESLSEVEDEYVQTIRNPGRPLKVGPKGKRKTSTSRQAKKK